MFFSTIDLLLLTLHYGSQSWHASIVAFKHGIIAFNHVMVAFIHCISTVELIQALNGCLHFGGKIWTSVAISVIGPGINPVSKFPTAGGVVHGMSP